MRLAVPAERVHNFHKLQREARRDTLSALVSFNRERGITVLLITHEMDIAEYGTRLVRFRDGRIQLDQKIAGMVKDAGKGLVLVVSKWDTADKDAFTRDELAAQIAASYDFVPWAPLVSPVQSPARTSPSCLTWHCRSARSARSAFPRPT